MNTSSRSTIVPLDLLSAADETRSGAKAYNCARLKQAGFKVPGGVVILSGATEGAVAAVASHPWFDGVAKEALFAVRSSGVGEDGVEQSFAGIHETVLNVSRRDLSAAVAKCKASARSTQAAA